MSLKSIQTEVDASFLYHLLSENEEDPGVADVFRQMSEIEKGHALAFLHGKGLNESFLPQPSSRAKTLKRLAKVFGYNLILGILLDTEKGLSRNILSARKKTGTEKSISDTAHVAILKNVLTQHPDAAGNLARFEKHHRNIGGNALRAAVLGGNDGLVSNFSLVMGVAGASSGQQEVLLAGIAGLLAGALSMALGEWVSVKSSQELYENQMEIEKEELEHNPEGEEKEIALIYQAKGIPKEQAKEMASEIMKDKASAHEVLVKEELGIDAEELKGSAMEAALSSFMMFAIGAILPVLPFFFSKGWHAILFSALLSTLGLFLIGSAITLFTGRSVLKSGFRQVIFGLAAAAVTYGIGSLIGASIS
ncbi:MAG: rubrerythrin family protein [Bacteroidetes bacterium]|nr:rubrerythrin family protein [Bacteroidota bacterium]